MTTTPRPVLIELDDPAPSPADAPPVPEALAVGAMPAVAAVATGGSVLGRVSVWVIGAFAAFVVSVTVWDFIANLLARNSILGAVGMALAVASVIVLAALALREAAGYARLARLDALRLRAVAARTGTLAEARSVSGAIVALYAGRSETAWGRQRLAERQDDVMDADALLSLTEAEVLAALDASAQREVEAAARRVALATALVPLALADVAVALWANLAMVRRVAEIYGGRAGSVGSWRLMRRVFSYLLATGALALTDDMIGTVAGGGLLSKLSRRFGEGVVNGALTARVGLAAIDLCRPMPFVALERPSVSALVGRALRGIAGEGAA
ncbi:MAG: YcjF family protein [Gemmobacter sp.]